jgi:hypothetical protein
MLTKASFKAFVDRPIQQTSPSPSPSKPFSEAEFPGIKATADATLKQADASCSNDRFRVFIVAYHSEGTVGSMHSNAERHA